VRACACVCVRACVRIVTVFLHCVAARITSPRLDRRVPHFIPRSDPDRTGAGPEASALADLPTLPEPFLSPLADLLISSEHLLPPLAGLSTPSGQLLSAPSWAEGSGAQAAGTGGSAAAASPWGGGGSVVEVAMATGSMGGARELRQRERVRRGGRRYARQALWNERLGLL
jgi:hypothetical protein